MKRLLLSYIIAVSFVACSNNEERFILPDEEKTSIEFGKMKTRAIISGADDILTFGVYADKNIGSQGTDGASQFTDYLFTNKKVYRADKNSPWGYDDKQYWVYDRIFHFFAYYPHADAAMGVGNPQRTEQGNYEIPFTTPNSADTDLLTAYASVDTNRPTIFPEEVNFNFSHSLSKVTVKVGKDPENPNNRIIIESVSFTGVKYSGICTLPRHNRNDVTSDDWNCNTEVTGFTRSGLRFELSDNVDEGDEVLGAGDGFLFIPQEIPENGVNLSVTYHFFNDDGTYAYQNTLNAPLPTNTVDEWEPANSYTYKINLETEDVHEILFSAPKVNPWTASSSPGGSLIIY